jgi:hypothetical protein
VHATAAQESFIHSANAESTPRKKKGGSNELIIHIYGYEMTVVTVKIKKKLPSKCSYRK